MYKLFNKKQKIDSAKVGFIFYFLNLNKENIYIKMYINNRAILLK